MSITWTRIASPLGSLLLAASPTGLIRVAFASEGDEQVCAELASRTGESLRSGSLPWAQRQIDEYFHGRRWEFDMPIDWSLTTGFRGQVQRALTAIPYGKTESYGEVARRLGNPGAVRAVGSACATNPLPIVVPCHRVLRSDGSLAGYRGGTEAKQLLLELEAEGVRSSG